MTAPSARRSGRRWTEPVVTTSPGRLARPLADIKRDIRAWFAGRIEWHTHGLLANNGARLPYEVVSRTGDVTDGLIEFTLRDGTVLRYEGGRYGRRRVALTYPPLMPREMRADMR